MPTSWRMHQTPEGLETPGLSAADTHPLARPPTCAHTHTLSLGKILTCMGAQKLSIS